MTSEGKGKAGGLPGSLRSTDNSSFSLNITSPMSDSLGGSVDREREGKGEGGRREGEEGRGREGEGGGREWGRGKESYIFSSVRKELKMRLLTGTNALGGGLLKYDL